MIKILCMDTALSNSAAIICDDIVDHSAWQDKLKTKASGLIDNIYKFAAEKQLKIEELNALAVNTGPGSFTGIRIGVALVKGIARHGNIPIITVNSFEAIRRIYKIQTDTSIILNAGAGYFYYFKSTQKIDEISLLSEQQMLEKFDNSEKIFFYGLKFEEFETTIGRSGINLQLFHGNDPLAPGIASIAIEKFKNQEFIDFRQLKPLYIRPSYVDL